MAPVVLHVAYPTGSSFNADYYINTHLPPAIKAWKATGGLVDWKVLTPFGEGSPYDALLQVTWESAEVLGKMQSETSPEARKALEADLPHYSTKAPSMWVTEVKAGQ
ncbi:hypothetical protein AB5N19_05919 [Seiridium cardinale]